MSHDAPNNPGNDPHAAQLHSHGREGDLEHDHAADHHAGGVALYVAVAIALLILTSFSYATQLPFWSHVMGDSVVVKRVWMMMVSCSKAMLVILFFMHLKWEANWKWVLTIPASLMSIFLVAMLVPDVYWRMNSGYAWYSPDRWLYAAEPVTDVLPAESHAEHDAVHDSAEHASPEDAHADDTAPPPDQPSAAPGNQ